jgi:Flp pilus assembly pilin Flp
MKLRIRPHHVESVNHTIARLLREESGQDLVEYSLLVVLIGTALIAIVDRFGDAVEDTFLRIARSIVQKA